jgi:hypothetical protein
LANIPVGRAVAAIHPADFPPPFLQFITATPATLVAGSDGATFIDARHREALQTFNWVRSFAPVGAAATAVPVSRGRVVDPNFDVDESGALVGASIIDARMPFATQLVVPLNDAIAQKPPSWLFQFGGTPTALTSTPPLGAQLVVPYQHLEVPYVWLRAWNGSPNAPIPRISPAGQMVATAKDQWQEQPPFAWNWNGAPVIPGIPPPFGSSVIVSPYTQEAFDLPWAFVWSAPEYTPPPASTGPPQGGHGSVDIAHEERLEELEELDDWRLREYRRKKAEEAKRLVEERKTAQVDEMQARFDVRKADTQLDRVQSRQTNENIEKWDRRIKALKARKDEAERRLEEALAKLAAIDDKLEKQKREEREAFEVMMFLMSDWKRKH